MDSERAQPIEARPDSKADLATARRQTFRTCSHLAFALSAAFLFAVYWPSLRAWFMDDDFAWLSLWRFVHDGPSFLGTMFRQSPIGSFRPISERGFFYLFRALFGTRTVIWHSWVFLNAAACVWLLNSVVRRELGSTTAGLVAGLFWLSGAGLATALTWLCAYNEILCTLCLLLALWFRIKRAGWAELTVFLIGFGVLELNVIYPLIALAWTAIAERSRARKDYTYILGLFLLSGAYAILHRMFAPGIDLPSYERHYGTALLESLRFYWVAVWSPSSFAPLWKVLATLAGSVATLSVLIYGKTRLGLFGLAWFAIAIALFLPLSKHLSNYYLVVPSVGIAMVVSSVYAQFRDSRKRAAVAAAVCVLLVFRATEAERLASELTGRSIRVKKLVDETARARQASPGKTILLEHVDQEMYNACIRENAFFALGVPQPLLTPDAANKVRGPEVRRFSVSPQQYASLIAPNAAVTMDARNGELEHAARE